MLEALGADAPPEADRRQEAEAALQRLKRQWAEVTAIDFFDASGRGPAERLLARLETRLRDPPKESPAGGDDPAGPGNRVWVTRQGIHVDRMASAWLIRRFIDPQARFRFVRERDDRPQPGEVRFDMFEAEFTHEGDCCTFEVLLTRCGLDDPALRDVAETVHEIDLKDRKFGRPESDGIAAVVAGFAQAHRDDEDRLVRRAALFDDLFQHFRRRRRP